MISKELLSEVLEVKIDRGKDIRIQDSLLSYGVIGNYTKVINTYELAYKCKEWAFWRGYEIITRMRIPDIYRGKYIIDYGFEIYKDDDLKDFAWWSSSESEAVLKACYWILHNEEDNNES